MGDRLNQILANLRADLFEAQHQASDGLLKTTLSSPSSRAVALLVREVLCEKIYREREKWNAEHPNKSLGLRDINLDAVAAKASTSILMMDKEHLRQFAAQVLDLIDGAK